MAITVLRTSHTGFLPSPKLRTHPPWDTRGPLTLQESALPLSVSLAAGHPRQPLYWAFGEVGRHLNNCPRLGCWTVELIRHLLNSLTCSLLGLQGPASQGLLTHMGVQTARCWRRPQMSTAQTYLILAPQMGPSLYPASACLWSIPQQMKWRITGC